MRERENVGRTFTLRGGSWATGVKVVDSRIVLVPGEGGVVGLMTREGCDGLEETPGARLVRY